MSTLQPLINPRVLLPVLLCIGLCSCAPPQQSAQPAPPQPQVSAPATQQVSEPSDVVPTKPSQPAPATSRPAPVKAPLQTTVVADYSELTLIEGGSFIMGDIYGNDQYAKPPHKVTVSDFYIARFEVTFDEFDRFCTATGRPLPDDNGWGRGDRPVINVTHAEAVAFTAWLSERTGRTFRLPSEAEWEYAARAGKSTNFWWGTLVGKSNANCRGCGSRWDGRMTAPVGSFAANPYGLHDIHGNVYEWVADSWHEDYVGAPTDGMAWIDANAEQYVSRGGSFLEIPPSLHVYSRNWSNGDQPRSDIGFRVVMEP